MGYLMKVTDTGAAARDLVRRAQIPLRVGRESRNLRDAVWLASSRQLYPRCAIIRTYWWDGTPNFGDLLTPYLLRHYGVAAVLSNRKRTDLVGIGSVLTWIPQDFIGTIWGSGLMEPRESRFPHARIFALRGHRTYEHLGKPAGAVLGDPGLLARRTEKKPVDPIWNIGIVPHHSHSQHPVIAELAARLGRRGRTIDVSRPPVKCWQKSTPAGLSSVHLCMGW